MAPMRTFTSTRTWTSPASGCTSYSSTTSLLLRRPAVERSGGGPHSRPPRRSAAGQADDQDEEVVDLAHHGDEPLEVHGLGDVGVGVEVVAAQDVLLRLGGGEDDDGDAA